MKRVFIVAILALMPLQLMAGDVIGGGTLSSRDIQLDRRVKAHLVRQGDLDIAYDEWLRTMSPQQQEIIMEKVFDRLIVPQLNTPR